MRKAKFERWLKKQETKPIRSPKQPPFPQWVLDDVEWHPTRWGVFRWKSQQ